MEFELLARPSRKGSSWLDVARLGAAYHILSKPKDLAPGRYCVEFGCRLPLAACDIQFIVGLSSHTSVPFIT